MQIIIPWRVKKFFSDHFPLFYHLIANLKTSANSSQYWDNRLAETWDAESRNWPTKSSLIESLTNPIDRILDIACGNGSILRYLKARGYQQLYGLEISYYAINRLKAEGIQMYYAKLPNIPLGDETFDVVIASQVLEHIIRRRHFLKEIRRILKPDGRAFIFVPDDCLGPIDENEHVIKYNRHSLKHLLSRYFFVEALESIKDINYEMRVLYALVKKR